MSIADEAAFFSSADDYRPISAVTAGFTIPLGSASQGAARAVYKLPDTTVSLQRTFPRIMEARYAVRGVLVIVPMGHPGGFVTNGERCDDDVVLVARGSSRGHFVETHGNLVGVVDFGPKLPVQRWRMKDDALSLLRLPSGAVRDIRDGLREVAHARASAAAGDLQSGLFDRFDRAVRAGDIVGRDTEPTRMRYVAIVERIDGLLAERWMQPISNEEVAREIGLTSRTLHQAVRRIRGMSLHRYLRLRRLWSVRRQLVASSDQASVGLVALANGFRHMGEFAAAYRAAFGELPSDTAARPRAL
jgi:AraC family ethanolamine operon transcriptional activator